MDHSSTNLQIDNLTSISSMEAKHLSLGPRTPLAPLQGRPSTKRMFFDRQVERSVDNKENNMAKHLETLLRRNRTHFGWGTKSV